MEAVSHATLNMVSTGNKGSAFAVDIPIKVKAELLEKKIISIKGKEKETAKNTAKETLKLFNKNQGAELIIESEIPAKVGLGEKEAISVATALAIAGAIAKKDGRIMLLRIDKYTKEQFFIINGKVVNKLEVARTCRGEFDRVCASMFGGFAVTDNLDILRRGEMEKLGISIAREKSKKPSKELENEVDVAWQEVLRGNLYTGIKMNALVQGNRNAAEGQIKGGALTVGVSNGCIYSLTRNKKSISTMNEPSMVIAKPKKIVKIREFLELKGEQEYYFL